jgi:flavin reductase ActVB
MSSAQSLRMAIAQVPGPVAVVTTVDSDGVYQGFTVGAFCPLSQEPPMLLVCADKYAPAHTAFLAADRFLVNVLTDRQADLARRFASPGGPDALDGLLVPCEDGLPGLPEAAARFSCRLQAVLDGGDHSILIGRVVEAYTDAARVPLVGWNHGFATPAVRRTLVPAG